MGTQVVNDAERGFYRVLVDGERAGKAHYELRGDAIAFTHTVIDPERREEGLGTTLVREALDDVRAQTDYRVIAECGFVSSFIEEHPEYQDLLER